MYENSDQEEKFQRWAKHIRENVGEATDKILRYFWELYDFLINEIKTNKN